MRSTQKARCTQAQWLFSSATPLPMSASHTTYPATFGTRFSLLGFSHLGHWHKINEDTKKTQGSELEGVGGWGVKLLGCKIVLAAMLLFQHFMASPYTCLLSALFTITFFFVFFCPHHTSAWVWPFLCRGCIFIKRSNDNLACLVFMVVRLCFLDQSCRVIRVVHFCSLGGREQKVQQANIRTLIRPKMSNCSPAALITSNQSHGG